MKNKQICLKNLKRGLTIASLIYLSIPLIIFLAGWLKWFYSLIIISLLCITLIKCFTLANASYDDSDNNIHFSLPLLIIALIPAIGLSLISGAGGWGYQTSDWMKNNAIFKDLIEQPWPVYYHILKEKLMLVYYTGYFLPAALIGKIGGWNLANHTLFFTTIAGVILSALWVMVLNRGNIIMCGVVFAFFSGMDVLAKITKNIYGGLSLLSGDWWFIEFWGKYWCYQANDTLLFWVPNQAICGWIATALMLNAIRQNNFRFQCLFILSLTILWAPFVTAGLMPIVLFYIISYLVLSENFKHTLYNTASFINMTGMSIGIVLCIYFMGHFIPYSLPEIFLGDGSERSGLFRENGFFPFIFGDNTSQLLNFFAHYMVFCLLEFFCLSAVIFIHAHLSPDERKQRPLLILVTSILLILPLFRYGYFNDLVMRASIPVLFILCLLSIQMLSDWKQKPVIAAMVAFFLVIGSLNAFVEIRRQYWHMATARKFINIPDKGNVADLFEVQIREYNHAFVKQYMGPAKAPFRYLASNALSKKIDLSYYTLIKKEYKW